MISIIVPVFNEQESIAELHSRLDAVMQSIDQSYEIIFVNDGSADKSLDLMLEFSQKDKNIKVLEFSRNFGHQAAITAGLDYARGDAVITMDSDLQHPPELIPVLVKKWEEGYDVVCTCRQRTADTGLFKNVTSRFFYAMINR